MRFAAIAPGAIDFVPAPTRPLFTPGSAIPFQPSYYPGGGMMPSASGGGTGVSDPNANTDTSGDPNAGAAPESFVGYFTDFSTPAPYLALAVVGLLVWGLMKK